MTILPDQPDLDPPTADRTPAPAPFQTGSTTSASAETAASRQLPGPPPGASGRGLGCGAWLIVAGLLFIAPFTCARLVPLVGASIAPGAGARNTALISAASQLVLLGLPLLGLSFSRLHPAARGVMRAWLGASLLAALWIPIYLLPETATRLQMLLQSAAAALFVLILLLWPRRTPASSEFGAPSATRANRDSAASASSLTASSGGLTAAVLLLALCAGTLLLYPYFARTALGSLGDTLIALLLAALIGLTAALLVERFSLEALRSSGPHSGASVFLLACAAALGVLVILSGAPAFPFGVVQLLLLTGLAPAAIAAAVLLLMTPGADSSLLPADEVLALESQPARRPPSALSRVLPAALFIALAAAGPLAFVDPEETTLISAMSPGDLLQYAALAAGLSALIAVAVSLIAGLIYFWTLRRAASRRLAEPAPASLHPSAHPSGRTPAPLLAVSVVLFACLAAGAFGLHFTAGVPGLHGDRLFVILKDQADLSAAAELPDPLERRQAVFAALVSHAETSQAGLRGNLDRFGIRYTPFYLVNAIEVPDNPLLRLWLLARPDVERILPSPVLRPLPEIPPQQSGMSTAPPEAPEWNLTRIGADKVWRELGVRGAGVLIGQSDSGVQGDHPELADGYRGLAGGPVGATDSWYDPWYGTTTPVDIGGHGTHTLGSALGNHVGVAPDAQWIGCVNLARNMANPAIYLACWQFNLAPFSNTGQIDAFAGDPTRGAHVLNNSWGCPELEGCDAGTFLYAVRALRAAGVFVVVSAGNDGPACGSLTVPPPVYAEVTAVGAMDRGSRLATFSSIGPLPAAGQRTKPDLIAPGDGINSSLPGSTYGLNSGTSMAGPHVVGVVALMWSGNPRLIGDIERTEQILYETARPISAMLLHDCPGAADHPSTAAGYGLVDAFAAVQRALAVR